MEKDIYIDIIRNIYPPINEMNYHCDSNDIISSTYGKVYKITNDGHAYALKQFKDLNTCDQIIEYISMKYLSSCLNVAQVYDLLYYNRSYALLMDYYPYTLDYMKVKPPEIFNCLKQLNHFAHVLSQQGLIHRDLKLHNIMINDQGVIKVIDFGMACFRNISMKHNVCTIWYRAPEILKGLNYNCRSDWWSIGVIIVQLIVGQPLFKNYHIDDMLNEIDKFDKAQKRFKNELKIIKNSKQTINDYQPKWPYLKLLKQLYEFSSDIYLILMNLLQINPKYRRLSIPFEPIDNNNPIILEKNMAYGLNIPELNIYGIKPKAFNEPMSILNMTYLNYNKLLYSSEKNQHQLIYIDDFNYHNISIQTIVNNSLDDLFKQNCSINDPYLDILINGMYMFHELLLMMSHQSLLNKTLILLLSKDATQDELQPNELTELLKICISLSHEIIDDHYMESDYYVNDGNEKSIKFLHIKQIIIDHLKHKLKQERNFFHKANNLTVFNQYNLIYNLLYLNNPKIWVYKYNYIICHLQVFKHGVRSSFLPDFIPNPMINELIDKFIHQQWSQIVSKYSQNQYIKACLKISKSHIRNYQKSWRQNRSTSD